MAVQPLRGAGGFPVTNNRGAARFELLDVQTTTTPQKTCITMVGEADSSTHEHLKATLGAVDTRGRRVELRLGQLEFCDVASAWELLELVREAKHNGADVHVVDQPNAWVRTMLRILDIEDDLALSPAPNSDQDPEHDA